MDKLHKVCGNSWSLSETNKGKVTEKNAVCNKTEEAQRPASLLYCSSDIKSFDT